MCGVGNVSPVDLATSMNPNTYGPRFTRVDVPCFGVAETHELGHNMGAVLMTAPHSTTAGHCTDEYDIMCYNDCSTNPRTGAPVVMDYSNNTPVTGKCMAPVKPAALRIRRRRARPAPGPTVSTTATTTTTSTPIRHPATTSRRTGTSPIIRCWPRPTAPVPLARVRTTR